MPPPGQPQVGEGQAVQVASGRCTLAGKSTWMRTQNEEQGGRGRLRGFVVARSGPPRPTAQEGPVEGSSPPHRHTQASGRLGRQLRRAWLSKGLGPCPRRVVCHGAAWGCDTPFLSLGHTPGIFSQKAGGTDTQRACSQPTSFYWWPRRKEENGGFVGKAWRNCSALHVGLQILVDQQFADPGWPLIYPPKAAGRAVSGGGGGGRSDPE